jgi:hypothetical protein
MKKRAHELNREFSKEELQMTSKYMKKCSTSWLYEMQIKMTLRVHLTLVKSRNRDGRVAQVVRMPALQE